MRDMGGLRKWMPQTYKTFIIATGALIGIFPLAGFWSKDEILAGAAARRRRQLQMFMVVGIIGALMTAVHDAVRVPHLLRRVPGSRPSPRVGPAHRRPLWILAMLGVFAGLVNLPSALAPDSVELRFEHYYEPVGAYFPSIVPFRPPRVLLGIASEHADRVLGIGIGIAWYWPGSPPASPSSGAWPRPALHDAGQQVLLRPLHRRDRGRHQGPVARGVNWFNQNVIDGVVNGAGRLATVLGRFVYARRPAGRRRAVNGSATAAQSGGQVFRQLTSGKVQQYGALLFGAAAVLAGAFIVFV